MEKTNSWEFFPVKLPNELKNKAILLYDSLGVHDIAWEYENVLQVIEYLRSKSIYMLGVDVLLKKLDGYKFTGDNWSIDNFEIDKGYDSSLKFITDFLKKTGTIMCSL